MTLARRTNSRSRRKAGSSLREEEEEVFAMCGNHVSESTDDGRHFIALYRPRLPGVCIPTHATTTAWRGRFREGQGSELHEYRLPGCGTHATSVAIRIAPYNFHRTVEAEDSVRNNFREACEAYSNSR